MKITGINGSTADVSPTGLLRTVAVSQSSSEVFNSLGLVFRINGTVTPAGANDYFFYFRNTGTNDVAIGVIGMSSSVPTRIVGDIVTGDPVYVGETPSEVVNLNLGSSTILRATANHDTNITGLTPGGSVSFIECAVANTLYEDTVDSSIFVPQGKAVAFRRVEATGEIDYVIGLSIVADI